jgi:hypothetical protein
MVVDERQESRDGLIMVMSKQKVTMVNAVSTTVCTTIIAELRKIGWPGNTVHNRTLQSDASCGKLCNPKIN